jgi:DNA polymerase I
MKKIYLVDVSSMFFRAFYAIRQLTSPAGVPVNAVYGFLSMLSKLMKEEKPDYMVFCYDRKEPSFRKDLYTEYKAHRTEMPPELAQQIPYIKQLADLMGVPSIEAPQYEADDLIGSLTRLGRANDLEVVIVSGDKDFGQLIEDHVVLFDTMKDIKYNQAGVLEKWGIRPDQFIDYLAICGDASDNVPGVKGIGEKGAIKLLQQFKSLEDIYENIDQVEGKSVKEKLIASKDNAIISKKLVTIVTDVEVPKDLSTYELRPMQRDGLRALLRELNFKTFEKNLLGEGDGEGVAHVVQAVNANTKPIVRAVTPTGGAPASEPITVAISIPAHTPTEYVEKTMSTRELAGVLEANQELWSFTDARGVFVANSTDVINITDSEFLGRLTDTYKIRWKGFDLKALWHAIGAQKPIAAWDSQLAAYVMKAGDTTDFAKIYTKIMMDNLPEMATPSQLLNCHVHFAATLAGQLKDVHGLKVYEELELPLVRVLLAMEKAGIRIDTELLAKQSAEIGDILGGLEKQIHEAAGGPFNIGSPKQLGGILFEKMGLPAGKKTKTGYSTDNEVLEGLDHPIAKLVLQWRELSKLKSTYVDALPTMVAEKDGRVHTSFNQALTTTGRLSSTHPNLQNIPIRTPRGQQVRQAFIADPNMKLISVDYSQIELRILAHISEDPGLCKAFAEDLDIHSATAAEIFNIALSDVTSEHRRTAKAVNFGIAYGQGAFGLAETLGISRSEGKDIIDRYFTKFRGVKDYIENTIKIAHEQGFVETLFGRRRYIDELKNKNVMLKKFGERAAINAPIQGTASDLVKKAMIECYEKVPLKMLLQVHDELIFEGAEAMLAQHTPALVKIMEGVASLRVPLKVNYSVGNNWDEAH